MSPAALIKIGCALIVIALLVGVVPGVATLIRDSNTSSPNVDTTQQASDVGSALSFLFMSLPMLLIGIGMLIVGIRQKNDAT